MMPGRSRSWMLAPASNIGGCWPQSDAKVGRVVLARPSNVKFERAVRVQKVILTRKNYVRDLRKNCDSCCNPENPNQRC